MNENNLFTPSEQKPNPSEKQDLRPEVYAFSTRLVDTTNPEKSREDVVLIPPNEADKRYIIDFYQKKCALKFRLSNSKKYIIFIII